MVSSDTLGIIVSLGLCKANGRGAQDASSMMVDSTKAMLQIQVGVCNYNDMEAKPYHGKHTSSPERSARCCEDCQAMLRSIKAMSKSKKLPDLIYLREF